MIASTEVGKYVIALGAKTSTPGGGAAAAITGAQTSALVEMVCQFTGNNETAIAPILLRAQRLGQKMLELGDDDVSCFNALMSTYKLPRSTEAEKSKRTESIQSSLIAAATVPINVIKLINDLIPDIQYLVANGNQNLITDVAIAASLGQSTLTSSRFNVLINLKHIHDQTFKEDALAILDTIPVKLQLLQTIIDEVTEQLS